MQCLSVTFCTARKIGSSCRCYVWDLDGIHSLNWKKKWVFVCFAGEFLEVSLKERKGGKHLEDFFFFFSFSFLVLILI